MIRRTNQVGVKAIRSPLSPERWALVDRLPSCHINVVQKPTERLLGCRIMSTGEDGMRTTRLAILTITRWPRSVGPCMAMTI